MSHSRMSGLVYGDYRDRDATVRIYKQTKKGLKLARYYKLYIIYIIITCMELYFVV